MDIFVEIVVEIVKAVVLPVEIGVLAIHFTVASKERADRKRRKEMQRQEEARMREIERKLGELDRLCPACPAPRRRDQTLGIAA